MKALKLPALWLTLGLVLVSGLAVWISQSATLREELFLLLLFVTLASSLNILLGYTGYVNFGHIVFFGLGGYVGFYPAHRGPMTKPYLPQLVQSPPGVVPLFRPIALVRAPSGRLLVQEYVTGRVSFLVEEQARSYLPVMRR